MDEQKIKEIVQETVSECKRQNMIPDRKHTAYQKTETLLYNYMAYKSVISQVQQEIADIEAHGIQQRSKSITSFNGNGGYVERESDMEKRQNQIDELKSRIEMTQRAVDMIDDALETIKGDMYYEIIPLKYFQRQSGEFIAEYFGVDTATVSRNKSRLVNELKIRLFSSQAILEMFA